MHNYNSFSSLLFFWVFSTEGTVGGRGEKEDPNNKKYEVN